MLTPKGCTQRRRKEGRVAGCSFFVGPANLDDTCLQGYLEATFPEIAAVFGEPARDGCESKITFRWIITFSDGTVATIYDYKIGTAWAGPAGLTPGAIRRGAILDWTVGGSCKRAVWLVRQALTAGPP
jgi:hypothetical protein